MNKLELQKFRNKNARLVKMPSKMYRNCVIFNIHNSMEHEMKRAEICYNFQSRGFEFFTEAEFSGGRRCDIFILDTATIIEIKNSESEESLKEKEVFYKNLGLRFEVVRVDSDAGDKY